MLVLTRQVDQEICLGPDIRIRVVALGGGQVRLGIEAPASIPIFRAELLAAVNEQNRAAGAIPSERATALLRRATRIVATPPQDPVPQDVA
jgi:carbon storage regulator